MTIIHTEASTGWGGQDIRVLREIEEMRRRGHQVVLACTPESPIWKAATEAGIPLEPVFFQKKISWPGVKTIASLIRKYRPDVVNTHSSADGWCGAVACRLTRRRGLPKHVRSRHLSNPLKANKANYLLYARLTDHTIVTGEALKTSLVEVNKLDPSGITSIPTGVDLTVFEVTRFAPEEFRQEIGAHPQDFVWVMVAILRGMKGHMVVIEAAAKILQSHPDTRFVFVGGATGPTPLPDMMENRMQELVIRAKCTLTGMREDIPRILRGCDAAVLASTHGEGVPQSLAQALCMGLPVVGTDVGAVGEIVREGAAFAGEETGFLARPGDADSLAGAMLRVMQDKAEARQRAKRGQTLIQEQYSLKAMTDKVEKVYQQALQKG